jgi:O-antigen ligase
MIGSLAATERVAYWLLVLSLGLTLFKLLAAQVVFGLAALLWLRLVTTDRQAAPLPAFTWPLVIYAGLTIVSALVSADRRTSVLDLRQLVLFLMVPMVMRLMRGERAARAIDVIIAMGAAGATVGVVQGMMVGSPGDLANRPMGTLSHYMTYSGLIMLVLCAAVARLLFHPHQRIWPGVAIPALVVALAVTMSRNAYVGAVVGVGTLLAAKRARLLLVLPIIAALVFVLAPASIRARALSVFDPQDESIRDRVQMIQMGRDMIRDHPLFGVGPDRVGQVYSQYLRPNPVHPYNPHLHNVPVQIAAERGLPALAAWLAFVASALAGLFRQLRHGPARDIAAAGVSAIIAMLVAGLFEYNFGDSEFLMLFLGLVTLPFAARLPVTAAAGLERVEGATVAASIR